MRRVIIFLLCLWICSASTFALELKSRETAVESPPCANKCTLQSLQAAHCSTDDIDCRCNNQQVNNLVSSCIATDCSLEDALGAAKAWAQQCDRPHGNHSAALRAAAIGSGVASTLIVICRVIARLYTVRRLWWDDWSHIVAGLFTLALLISCNLTITYGMGYHLYDIDISSISQMKDLVITYYLCQIFWLLLIYFIKISILFLYLRIFPEFHNFRLQVIGTMVFVTLAVIILAPMVIWQCVPIHAIWDFKRGDAKCLSIAGVGYATAAVNIATEVVVLILPLPLLRTLRVSWSQKLALYLLFGCGIIVVGVASARIPSLSHIEDTHDPTYLNAGVFYWTATETAVAHLCAAALAVRPFYVKIRNEIRRKRKGSTDSTVPISKMPGTYAPRTDSNQVNNRCSEGDHSLPNSDASGVYFASPPLNKSTTEELEAVV